MPLQHTLQCLLTPSNQWSCMQQLHLHYLHSLDLNVSSTVRMDKVLKARPARVLTERPGTAASLARCQPLMSRLRKSGGAGRGQEGSLQWI